MLNRIYSILLAAMLMAALVSCQKDDEVTPEPAEEVNPGITKMKITKIQVNSCSLSTDYDNDYTTPDYYIIVKTIHDCLLGSTEIRNNVSNMDLPLIYQTDFTVMDINEVISFRFYDYDAGYENDDYIDGYNICPAYYLGNTAITLNAYDHELIFTITVEWY